MICGDTNGAAPSVDATVTFLEHLRATPRDWRITSNSYTDEAIRRGEPGCEDCPITAVGYLLHHGCIQTDEANEFGLVLGLDYILTESIVYIADRNKDWFNTVWAKKISVTWQQMRIDLLSACGLT